MSSATTLFLQPGRRFPPGQTIRLDSSVENSPAESGPVLFDPKRGTAFLHVVGGTSMIRLRCWTH